MFKLVFLLPMMLVGGVLCLAGGVLLLPLLAVLPVLFGIGVAVFSLAVVVAIFGFVLRLLATLVVGAGGIALGVLGFGALFVGGIFVFAAAAHLLVPILIIAAIVWAVRRYSKPAPLLIRHDPV